MSPETIHRDGRLVILAGLPGAGKTTLADWLAVQHGFVVASRDTIRTAMFPQCRYSFQEKDAAFEAMRSAIVIMLGQGLEVVTDGITFSAAAQLRQIAQIGADAGVPTLVVHCAVPVDVAQYRVEHDRLVDPTVPADRDAALVEQVARRFDPLPDSTITIDTSASVDQVHRVAIKVLGLRAKT